MQFFKHLDWDAWNPSKPTEKFSYKQQHCGSWIDNASSKDRNLLLERKTIITVQHPHRCWVSFLTRGKTFDANIYCWKSLLEWLPKLDYTLFDINCPEENRKEQLFNVLRHVGKYTEENKQLTEQFVDENWIPAHPKDSQYKRDYIREGKLPNGYDYSKLQFAVDWYESLPSNSY